MPTVRRFISQKQAPVEGAVQAPSSLARQDSSIAQAIGGIGEQVAQFGELRAELARKTQANVDYLKTTRARADLEKAGLVYQAWQKVNPNPEGWVDAASKFASDVKLDTQGMSPQAQQRLQQEFDIARDEFIATATIEAVKTTGDNVVVAATSKYQETLEDPNSTEESRLAAREEFEEQVLRNRSAEVTASLADKLEEDAVSDRKDAKQDDIRQLAGRSPELAIQLIDGELETRKEKGFEPKEDDLTDPDLIATKQYAKSVIQSRENAVDAKYISDTGQAITEWTTNINSTTPEQVWGTNIPTPPGKEEDTLDLKKKVASIVDGIQKRQANIIADKGKAEREASYDPKVVSELKIRAENITGRQEIDELKKEAATALAGNIIDDSDLESILQKSEKTFTSVLDTDMKSSQTTFSRIMLKGTSSESLVPWLQGQQLAAQAAGEEIDIDQLMAAFVDVGKAKQWAVNQVKNEVELDMSTKESPTLEEQRKSHLASSKVWLNKSDTELVRLYRAWLTSKP